MEKTENELSQKLNELAYELTEMEVCEYLLGSLDKDCDCEICAPQVSLDKEKDPADEWMKRSGLSW